MVWAIFMPALFMLAAVNARPVQSDSTKPAASLGAPVVFAGDTLFHIRERVGSFPPEHRARAIIERLTTLSTRAFTGSDTLLTNEGETSTDILAGDAIIMTITDADAAGLARAQMVQAYTQKIQAALEKEAEQTSVKNILLGAFFSVLATVVAIVVLKLLNKLFAKIFAQLQAWRGTRIPALKIQNLEVLSADRVTNILLGFAKALRAAVVLLLLYFYLPLVFSFFPWTEGLAARLFGYVLSPLRVLWRGFAAYLPNIFFIAVTVFVTHYTVRFIRWIFNELGKGTIALPGFYPEWAEPTFKIVRFLVIAFVLIVVFPYLPGAGSPAFQGVSVFLGILFSLGSASAISNVVAGVVLTYTRAFNLGDRVKIGDTMGEVVERTLLVTRLRTIKNVDVTIPNAMVLGSHIINYSSSAQAHGLILHTTVTIGYDVPWRRVHALLLAAAANTKHILNDPPPFVLQAHTDQPEFMAGIYSELHQNIQDKFNEAGVEIMSPHYSAMRDGNQTTIPQDYLPKTYTPPSFRILPVEGLFDRRKPVSATNVE
ncbi:mechanosensitive ion channel [candidate division KSB1 bacterium]|nr:mechanosensitive ion channel [candidate division KSB1 bacterium]